MTQENKMLMTGLLCLGSLAVLGTVLPVASASFYRIPVQTASQQRSASGTIASLNQDSFTLEIGSTASINDRQNRTATMNVVLDANTTTDGKMQVGTSVEVIYREVNRQNIAVNVSVQH